MILPKSTPLAGLTHSEPVSEPIAAQVHLKAGPPGRVCGKIVVVAFDATLEQPAGKVDEEAPGPTARIEHSPDGEHWHLVEAWEMETEGLLVQSLLDLSEYTALMAHVRFEVDPGVHTFAASTCFLCSDGSLFFTAS
jgi:hypothetical protein